MGELIEIITMGAAPFLCAQHFIASRVKQYSARPHVLKDVSFPWLMKALW